LTVSEQKPTVFEHEHPAPAAAGKSFVVFLALAVLTVMALIIGFADLGSAKVLFSLGVAVAQGAVLALFFMDLKSADTQTWLIAVASVFWTGLMFLFTLTDYLTRHWYSW
jgi:cytochrome c oxidase subunit IV